MEERKGVLNMPKQIVLTALANRIEYATTNGKGLITGKREDITDEAIVAVFEHMMREYKRLQVSETNRKDFSYYFEGHGTITFKPEPLF